MKSRWRKTSKNQKNKMMKCKNKHGVGFKPTPIVFNNLKCISG